MDPDQLYRHLQQPFDHSEVSELVRVHTIANLLDLSEPIAAGESLSTALDE